MSALVLSAIERAGLGAVFGLRKEKNVAALRALVPQLEEADLLVLGALADRIRALEVGDDVRVFANVPRHRRSGEPAEGEDERNLAPPAERGVIRLGEQGRGLPLLRAVAIARITSPPAARVRVDWGATGLEIAQVALGFGANELEGPLANKRGLPIADDATKKLKGQGMVSVQALARKELEGLLGRAGRKAIFADGREDLAEVQP